MEMPPRSVKYGVQPITSYLCQQDISETLFLDDLNDFSAWHARILMEVPKNIALM